MSTRNIQVANRIFPNMTLWEQGHAIDGVIWNRSDDHANLIIGEWEWGAATYLFPWQRFREIMANFAVPWVNAVATETQLAYIPHITLPLLLLAIDPPQPLGNNVGSSHATFRFAMAGVYPLANVEDLQWLTKVLRYVMKLGNEDTHTRETTEGRAGLSELWRAIHTESHEWYRTWILARLMPWMTGYVKVARDKQIEHHTVSLLNSFPWKDTPADAQKASSAAEQLDSLVASPFSAVEQRWVRYYRNAFLSAVAVHEMRVVLSRYPWEDYVAAIQALAMEEWARAVSELNNAGSYPPLRDNPVFVQFATLAQVGVDLVDGVVARNGRVPLAALQTYKAQLPTFAAQDGIAALITALEQEALQAYLREHDTKADFVRLIPELIGIPNADKTFAAEIEHAKNLPPRAPTALPADSALDYASLEAEAARLDEFRGYMDSLSQVQAPADTPLGAWLAEEQSQWRTAYPVYSQTLAVQLVRYLNPPTGEPRPTIEVVTALRQRFAPLALPVKTALAAAWKRLLADAPVVPAIETVQHNRYGNTVTYLENLIPVSALMKAWDNDIGAEEVRQNQLRGVWNFTQNVGIVQPQKQPAASTTQAVEKSDPKSENPVIRGIEIFNYEEWEQLVRQFVNLEIVGEKLNIVLNRSIFSPIGLSLDEAFKKYRAFESKEYSVSTGKQYFILTRQKRFYDTLEQIIVKEKLEKLKKDVNGLPTINDFIDGKDKRGGRVKSIPSSKEISEFIIKDISLWDPELQLDERDANSLKKLERAYLQKFKGVFKLSRDKEDNHAWIERYGIALRQLKQLFGMIETEAKMPVPGWLKALKAELVSTASDAIKGVRNTNFGLLASPDEKWLIKIQTGLREYKFLLELAEQIEMNPTELPLLWGNSPDVVEADLTTALSLKAKIEALRDTRDFEALCLVFNYEIMGMTSTLTPYLIYEWVAAYVVVIERSTRINRQRIYNKAEAVLNVAIAGTADDKNFADQLQTQLDHLKAGYKQLEARYDATQSVTPTITTP